VKDLGGVLYQDPRDKTKDEEEYHMKLAAALSASMAPGDAQGQKNLA